MHTLTLSLCLQPPRHKICLELFLLRTCSNPQRQEERWLKSIILEQGRVRWTPSYNSWKNDILPEERIEVDKVRRKATRYWLSENQKLYKRSFSGPYLLCVHLELTELLLEELHEGICGSHTGGRSLAHKAITQGYWWPNMQRDALEYVKSVINANGLHRAYINQGESLIRNLAHGHSLNGA